MVTSLLLEGMQPLDEETLRRITGLMVERRLTPEWVPASPPRPPIPAPMRPQPATPEVNRYTLSQPRA